MLSFSVSETVLAWSLSKSANYFSVHFPKGIMPPELKQSYSQGEQCNFVRLSPEKEII